MNRSHVNFGVRGTANQSNHSADRHRSSAFYGERGVCRTALAFLTIILVLCLVGCSTEQLDRSIAEQKQAQAVDDRAAATVAAELAALRDAKNKLAVELAEARAEAKDTAAIEARLAVAEKAAADKAAVAAELDRDKSIREAVIAELQKQREAAGDPLAQIGQGAQTAGRFVPAPWGELIGLAGLIIGGIAEKKRRQTKADAVEAIGTFSTAVSSGLIPLSEEAKARLSASQSPRAKAIVKTAQAEYSDAMTLAKPVPPDRPTAGG